VSLLDVVVPTVTGREESLERCISSYKANTAPGTLNIIVVKDEPTCGLAWTKGIEKTTAPYIALTCDDLEIISPIWAGACIEVCDSGRLPCPIIRRPDGSLESCGGDTDTSGHLLTHMQPDGAEVDFAPVPFGSREQIEAIGMHDGHYKTDTYFSHKGRKLGWPTVVTHGYAFIHHHSSVGRITPSLRDDVAYVEAMDG